jgi:hypothetical protein
MPQTDGSAGSTSALGQIGADLGDILNRVAEMKRNLDNCKAENEQLKQQLLVRPSFYVKLFSPSILIWEFWQESRIRPRVFCGRQRGTQPGIF